MVDRTTTAIWGAAYWILIFVRSESVTTPRCLGSPRSAREEGGWIVGGVRGRLDSCVAADLATLAYLGQITLSKFLRRWLQWPYDWEGLRP
ncbi:hypothetical protein AOG23_30170 [Rhizobium acidisoli]|nr:hypothetical protein AOG23_30170 [Rhizobium acidisoli]